MRRMESGSRGTIVLRPSKPQHQPFLKRTPSSKSRWVEIDFDPPENSVHIIHLFFWQAAEGGRYEVWKASERQGGLSSRFSSPLPLYSVWHCSVPISTITSRSMCVCAHGQRSEKVSCIRCTVNSVGFFFFITCPNAVAANELWTSECCFRLRYLLPLAEIHQKKAFQ